MKAILAEQYGGPEVLQLAHDVPEPRVGPNGVLVQIHASSVNPVDWKYRRGLLEPVRPVRFPVIWGADLSWVVTEVGPAVTLFKPGDEVFYAGALTRPGSNAEFHLVDERIVGPKPRSLNWSMA